MHWRNDFHGRASAAPARQVAGHPTGKWRPPRAALSAHLCWPGLQVLGPGPNAELGGGRHVWAIWRWRWEGLRAAGTDQPLWTPSGDHPKPQVHMGQLNVLGPPKGRERLGRACNSQSI